jgi:hypothetical protein
MEWAPLRTWMSLTHSSVKELATESTLVPMSLQSLRHAFAEVPGPRRAASVEYRLVAIHALSVAALLAGRRSVLAIAEWGAPPTPTLRIAL